MPLVNSTELDTGVTLLTYQHWIRLGDRDRPCWSFLTTGLPATLEQQDLVLTLVVEEDDPSTEPPAIPPKLFHLMINHVRQGKPIRAGQSARLGQSGLLGFQALYCLPAIAFHTLPNLSNYLAMILVHEDELVYAKSVGLAALINKLGLQCSAFPYPSWNSRLRPTLALQPVPNHIPVVQLNAFFLMTQENLDISILGLNTAKKNQILEALQQDGQCVLAGNPDPRWASLLQESEQLSSSPERRLRAFGSPGDVGFCFR